MVRGILECSGHRVIEAVDYTQAHSILSVGLGPDLLLIEGAAEGSPQRPSYLRLLEAAKRSSVCLIAGAGEIRVYEEARGLGVRYFLMKPITQGDLESLVEELRGPSAHHDRSDVQPSAQAAVIEELGDNRYFLAASPAMLEIHRQAMLLADIDVTVLILGESGTGKEVIANLIHKHSRRSRQKLLNVNCAALPAELLESELFGHRQGAFTGAIKDRAGRFEQANRGTILLDEIGEISAPMQAKLLHVLQDGQFQRLGGQESTRVDVRILAATNVEMETALREKTFREDLFYRLSAFTIQVPPLRERREEIPSLIEETIRRAPAEMKTGGDLRFPSRLIDAALLYDWRGNVRELRNFVTRTIIMRDHDAAVRELETRMESRNPACRQPVAAAAPQCAGMRSVVRELKDRTETQMIQEALDAAGWNRRRAAKNLNISYRALLYKIQQHRLLPRVAGGVN
jgi:two-component system, NtrC family, response regulator AtoC